MPDHGTHPSRVASIFADAYIAPIRIVAEHSAEKIHGRTIPGDPSHHDAAGY